jgi:selenocysteine-specific elongation factor
VELRVIATAGHVDHGKSSLIVRLTGIDPDRWAEEKRRGLTIDLGYAWTTLPSGREVGFVDVPGHERFIRNMLAGVGPVRLVLFVVAADEGWKPQSEEHLQILDVLGVAGGVVALTKRDLVDDETLAIADDEVRERLAGTALEGAPVIPVSAHTGEGMEALAAALDAMLTSARAPQPTRTRLFVDRVFTIKGAGTVVTGTLSGGDLALGDEVEVLPAGRRARIRSLQTHKRQEETASPVSRVAANLVGAEREELERGDVLAHPGRWRATSVFDAVVRPVRGVERIPARGAFKVYVGAAEADATMRQAPGDGEEVFVRIRSSRPLTLDLDDRIVIREAGRRTTVGGGRILDVAPPRPFGEAHVAFLRRRADARTREEIVVALIEERGAVPATEVRVLTGADLRGDDVVGGWCVAPQVRDAVSASVLDHLAAFHRTDPLEEGAPLLDARRVAVAALTSVGASTEGSLVDALLGSVPGVVRTATSMRLATHRVALEERSEDLQRLLEAISGPNEATPPTVRELVAGGIPRDVLEAASRAGQVLRIATDLVVSRAFVDRALAEVARRAAEGITVSQLREALGTSRKYAVPLVEWMDAQGLTRREGDLRFLRG